MNPRGGRPAAAAHHPSPRRRREVVSMIAFILLELTFAKVLADIPHDTAALVVYLVLAAFLGFIWHGSRGGSADTNAAGGEPRAR
jgi:hypothetical protein